MNEIKIGLIIEDFVQPESGDVIILRFNPEEYEISQVKAMFDCIKNAFPSNNVIAMPAGVSFSITDRETCLSFLQKTIEEIKE